MIEGVPTMIPAVQYTICGVLAYHCSNLAHAYHGAIHSEASMGCTTLMKTMFIIAFLSSTFGRLLAWILALHMVALGAKLGRRSRPLDSIVS